MTQRALHTTEARRAPASPDARTTRRCAASPAHPPSHRSLGGSLTDLLADQARSGASEPPTATRMVLDTSVLISDPDCITAFPGADTVIPLVVVEELDQHKGRMDDVGSGGPRGHPRHRGAAGRQRRRHPHAGAAAQRGHAADRDQRAAPERDPRARPRPDQERQPHPGRLARAGRARAHRRRLATTPPCASRPPSSAWRRWSTSASGVAPPSSARGLDHHRGDARHRRPALRPPGRHRHRRARRPRRRHACGDGARRPLRRAAGGQPVGARAPRRRRARADAAGARAVGPAPALEGAAVRPRPPARPRGAGGRPRRHGRHRQDDPRPGRRPRAGDGDQPVRQGGRVPTRRPRRQGRARASCPARSTRSSTRG